MSENLDSFVPLDRSFHDLSATGEGGDEVELRRMFGSVKSLRWSHLLAEPRVVLLSEAGSGKTSEIRYIAQQMRQKGKQAFFLRIEHVVQDFESSFEEGTLEEFTHWLASGSPGWLLLDSIDEARLNSPLDFERAIRKLGTKLRQSVQNVHILITGRTDAWRPKTDLMLCEGHFPYNKPEPQLDSSETEAGGVISAEANADRQNSKGTFRVVALDDLHGDQVERFAYVKGVVDVKAFITAVDHADAWPFTTRPLDLAETIEFWNAHGRIGARLELMRHSISKRLAERDQNRADARPITRERVRQGARWIAAAATLAKESTIRVPDGLQNSRGLPVKEVLKDWDDADCATLLSRPIFDEGIYGTVRFHHRSVREFLTAEWLHNLIIDAGSRAKIEALFFRRQYGQEVVVPTMRPILPWLSLLDAQILNRVVRLSPEILFEGGDPASLPLETRRSILRQTCEQISQPAHGRSMMDYSAVQRFTSVDLADDIGGLLDRYIDDDDITWFLLRMVLQGQITSLAPKAKRFALESRSKYTRLAAIRALVSIGSADDIREVRKAFLTEASPLQRDWFAEWLPSLPASKENTVWLLEGLEKVAAKPKYDVDPLSKALLQLVREWSLNFAHELISGLHQLLIREPVIERRHCHVSKHYGWLSQSATEIVFRLISARHPSALSAPVLPILRILPALRSYEPRHDDDRKINLKELVQSWPELNRALFWFSVAEERAACAESGERLTDYWRAGAWQAYWGFDPSAFPAVCTEITSCGLLDDRLVALSLAFNLYLNERRPSAWRRRLKSSVKGVPELEESLHRFLHPPPAKTATWQRQEAAFKKQAELRAVREKTDLLRSKDILLQRIGTLRDPGSDTVNEDQHYLYRHMDSADKNHNHWSDANWKSLIPSFGEQLAWAFREGAVRYWRTSRPTLPSEGATSNSTPFGVIFGLLGLEIEARESEDWPISLTSDQAALATRYALHELNGFPFWLPQLYDVFPTEVSSVVITEVIHQLAVENADTQSHGTLDRVVSHGQWLWSTLAPTLLSSLRAPRSNSRNLRSLLTIIQGSSVDDTIIAKIATRKAKAVSKVIGLAPVWFGIWVGVEPAVAIPALAARLAELPTPPEQANFATQFIVNLVGGRSQAGQARQGYRTVEHMKSLYMLMVRHIREHEDIQRANMGVYSPGLRDDAQDARNALAAFIRETPGKAAYLALQEMSLAHPTESSRPWMGFHAKEKAATDADIEPWLPKQIAEFSETLTRTPTNHRDLWYMAVSRLEDLKHDLEDGDASIASLLMSSGQETEHRKFIGGWCRDRAFGRYHVPQEEELADAKRPDLRFLGAGFDAPVPAELKLADKWTGPHLFERLENQLCGDYLRDARSSRGIFCLIYQGEKKHWELPQGGTVENFSSLIDKLRLHWSEISSQFPGIEDIAVIGIDLTRRGGKLKTVKTGRNTKTCAAAKVRPNDTARSVGLA